MHESQSYKIRFEEPKDIASIRAVNIAAFRDHPHSNQTEHKIVDALREDGALTLSLVAEDDEGDIIGHVAISPVTIDGEKDGYYGLGPVAVLPDNQKQGAGTELVKGALRRIKLMNAKLIVVFGDPKYYTRFGFYVNNAIFFKDAPNDDFMIYAATKEKISGEVIYNSAFYTA